MAAAYENSLSCAVCLELYDDPRILPCGHSYCLKCLLDLSNKSSIDRVITCPICQFESSCEYGDPTSYIKNYELNNLVQSLFLDTRTGDTTGDTTDEAYLCEICDQENHAQRACVECDMMYCESCFNTYHPMKGKLAKHKIVGTVRNLRRQRGTKMDDRNMYCKDCSILISGTDISQHHKHDIVSVEEAYSDFKVKLEDLIQSTFKYCLDKSKEKVKLVESIFKEVELEVTRIKEEVLSKLGVDIKVAEASIESLVPAISTSTEQKTRADMISFIEECEKNLRSPSLTRDFDEVHRMFERIDNLHLSNESVIRELKQLEIRVRQDGPKITRLSHAIKERSKNKVILEWTPVENAESYTVFSKVNAFTRPVASTKFDNVSCLLDNIDGSDTTELWVIATLNGRDSLPSASVMGPTVTLPNLQFVDKQSNEWVRGPTNMRSASTVLSAAVCDDYYSESEVGLRSGGHALANSGLSSSRLYWEVEASHVSRDRCTLDFGVTPSATYGDSFPGNTATSWVACLRCVFAKTTIRMRDPQQRLHEVHYCEVTLGHHTHRYGLLMDIDNRSLSVIDVKNSTIIYTFENVDTSQGILPVFTFSKYDRVRLVDPAEIQHAPLLPFPVIS